MTDILDRIAARSAALRQETSDEQRKLWGQYFTGPEVAHHMARRLCKGASRDVVRVLDPGAGTGILGVALARELLRVGARRVELVAIEREPSARDQLGQVLKEAQHELGLGFSFELLDADVLGLAEPELGTVPPRPFDCVIANPPYFKMPPSETRGGNSPNIYTRFMEVTARLLAPGGRLCFIIPRSFASGLYFRSFRKSFHARMALEWVHIFASRKDAFKDDGVLQENIIVLYSRESPHDEVIEISSSLGAADLVKSTSLRVPRTEILDKRDDNGVLFLPETTEDLKLMGFLRGWKNRLRDFGLDISTGPVVPFRASERLCHEPEGESTVPLLWMQHVRTEGVRWPSPNRFRKPQHIRTDASAKLLVPNKTYVLLRRFSAKEEARRLTAAVLERDQIPGENVGLENHLNFIHRPGGELELEEARGMAALLNSGLLDRYFRISNGNTQVNASEIRAMPLPPIDAIKQIGARIGPGGSEQASEIVEEIVGDQGR